MEPVTQALLGAATGHLVAGRRIGRQALLFGALVGMLPDLDIVLGPLDAGFGRWIYHRGTTHSLWFGFVVGPLLGYLLWRWRDPDRDTPLPAWIGLGIVALVTHPILDGFTPYGTQFFAPFSRTRFAWNGVAIVDPIYTALLGAGVFFAASGRGSAARTRVALVVSLLFSSLYLTVGLVTNHSVVTKLAHIFEAEAGPVSRVRAYPTIFQPWLRYFVVHVEDRRYVGFHSLMRPECPSWRVHALPPSNARIETLRSSWEGQLLEWFADGEIGIEERRVPFGTLVRIDDLRYGWADVEARGMWGLEALFDKQDRMNGPIRRFGRTSLGDRDLARFVSAILGDLPDEAEGWTRPRTCTRDAELGVEPDATPRLRGHS